jgi:hypothetical protein
MKQAALRGCLASSSTRVAPCRARPTFSVDRIRRLGATAQRGQAELRVAELEAEGVDVDEAVVGHLADLHSAIARHLRTGRNVDEVRFVLRRVFERFVIADAESGQAIVAHVRPEALDELMADVGAAKREAIRLQTTDSMRLLIE